MALEEHDNDNPELDGSAPSPTESMSPPAPAINLKGGGMDSEDCVPVSALASPGEDEQMTTPEVGDIVQYQKEGKITRIEGDNAYVTVQSVNGKPVTPEDAKTLDTPEAADDAEFAALQDESKGRMM